MSNESECSFKMKFVNYCLICASRHVYTFVSLFIDLNKFRLECRGHRLYWPHSEEMAGGWRPCFLARSTLWHNKMWTVCSVLKPRSFSSLTKNETNYWNPFYEFSSLSSAGKLGKRKGIHMFRSLYVRKANTLNARYYFMELRYSIYCYNDKRPLPFEGTSSWSKF
jgi:hypothetical protein